MDFSRAPLTFILGWPVLILVICGVVSIFGAIGYGLAWIIDHIAWVQP